MSSIATGSEQEPTEEELPGAQLKDTPPNNYDVRTKWPYNCELYDQVAAEPSEADKMASDIVTPL